MNKEQAEKLAKQGELIRRNSIIKHLESIGVEISGSIYHIGFLNNIHSMPDEIFPDALSDKIDLEKDFCEVLYFDTPSNGSMFCLIVSYYSLDAADEYKLIQNEKYELSDFSKRKRW